MKEINRHEQMDRYFMFLYWKNQYCENDYSTKGNVQIQCNPYQLINGIVYRDRTTTKQNKKHHNLYGSTKTLNSQSNLERKIELKESTFLTSDYTKKLQLRQYDKWNKSKSPEINSYTYRHLIFDKVGKNIHCRKDSLLNKWSWGNCTATCKRMKLEHFLTLYIKINSKWIKDLNVRLDTIKFLEENIRRTLYDLIHSEILYEQPPILMQIKTKINNWDLIKLKSLYTAKEIINKMKRQP